MAKLNMREIAKLANVSVATVSRTLKSPHLVSEKTRAQIISIIKKSGYVYNASAADLSRNKSSVIGVLVPSSQHTAFGQTVFAILQKAQEEELSTIIGNTKFDPDIELTLMQRFRERPVAGLIVTGFNQKHEKQIKDFSKNGIPCVVVWERLDDKEISYVGFENHRAAREVTEYLIGLNHKRIGLIAGPYSKVGRVRKRLEGYKAALERHGITFDPSLVLEREPNPVEGKEAMARLLDSPNPPTAVFAASDELAIGASAAARDMGLQIPEDISLAGFDDIDITAFCNPPLTTVRVPAFEMGQMAVKVLLEIMSSQKPEVRQYCLDYQLIIRKSCAPLKR